MPVEGQSHGLGEGAVGYADISLRCGVVDLASGLTGTKAARLPG